MRSVLLSLLRTISRIFLIDSPVGEATFKEEFLDQTKHYQKELPNCQIDGVYICFRYTAGFKNILERFKYRYEKNLHKDLAPYYIRLFENFSLSKENAIITGVPMFFLHSLKRGYNQSFLLAKTFADNSQIPYFTLTKKKRWTAHQARLSREERLRNLSGAFVIDSKYSKFLENNTIYIVDDVISTGTTVNEIAGVLKQFGAKKVVGLFLASQKQDDIKEGLDKRKK